MKKWLLMLLIITLTGCSSGAALSEVELDDQSNSNGETIEYLDNTPVLYLSVFDQDVAIGNDLVEIDFSHIDQGYLGIVYQGSNEKPKIQITTPSQSVYTYNLTGKTDFFNLSEPEGEYQVAIYENISGTKYSTIYKKTFAVTQENDHIAFLYNNQFINFNETTQAVTKSSEVVATATSELDKIRLVFNYVTATIDYDHQLADTVSYGYIPDLDAVLTSKKGICFDYAALMACMLRTQGIATKMEFGYVNENYHAWISVYTQQNGWIDNFIHFENDSWQMMDPTYVAQNPTSSKVKEFTTTPSNYQIKYVY